MHCMLLCAEDESLPVVIHPFIFQCSTFCSFNQWDFETAFNTHYPQCRVFTFDHTIEASSSKPNGTQWFKKGLGEVDDESKKLLSLAGMAALTNVSFIDVLKIDCEGCEFEVFRDARTLEFLKSFVAQVQIEVHIGYGTLDGVAAIAQNLLDIGAKPPRAPAARRASPFSANVAFDEFDRVCACSCVCFPVPPGFRMFSKEPNLLAGPGTDTVEVALINSHQWLRRWEERGRRDRQERAAGGPGDAGEEAPAATVQ